MASPGSGDLSDPGVGAGNLPPGSAWVTLSGAWGRTADHWQG